MSRGRPSLSAGLRGLQRLTFHLETAETDQHSGTTGGVARNPVAELAQLVAEIFDARTGRVKIPGFYDDVEKLTKKQVADFKAAGFSVKGFMTDHGFKSIRTKDPLEVMKRLWAHADLRGARPRGRLHRPRREDDRAAPRGAQGLGPPRPGHEGREGGQAREGLREEAEPRRPGRGRLVGPALQGRSRAAPGSRPRKRSFKFAFGKDPVFVREGGTIGAVLSMEQILKCPIVFMGLSLPDHGYHAPNENYDWGQAGGGIVAFAKFFEEVAAR